MITERPDQGRSPGLLEAAPRAAGRAGGRRDIRAVVKAYVSLTKPRIVELLLVTTVPAMVLAVVSVVAMGAFTNWLATAMTAASIFYYDVVYTLWLKRRTPANTFWGGICGAAPVLIGWAAVTGSVAPLGWALFAVVFFWQMPHFYALAIKYKDDYARAGIPMLPVVRSAGRVNAEIGIFTVLMLAASLVAWPLGLGPIYGVTAVVTGAIFLLEAVGLVRRSRRGEPLKPMRLFHWSYTYLTILFIAVAVDALI
jgi:protoheme IX farnesyltransferase